MITVTVIEGMPCTQHVRQHAIKQADRCCSCVHRSWVSFLVFRSGVSTRFGRRGGQLLCLIGSTTFHLPFYMSRPLPNTYAFMGSLLAHGVWMRGETVMGMGAGLAGLAILAPFAVIFRCDLLVLIVPWSLQLLLSREILFSHAAIVGLSVTVCSAALSRFVDTWFWGTVPWEGHPLIWPEANVLLFNTVDNKSSEWGTAPWHWYFTRAIPKVSGHNHSRIELEPHTFIILIFVEMLYSPCMYGFPLCCWVVWDFATPCISSRTRTPPTPTLAVNASIAVRT